VENEAQGWYRDPWAVHQDRYFSGGMPTKLVRDDGQESWDPPPERLPPEGDLVPAGRVCDEIPSESDSRRADQACDDPPYDGAKAFRAVFYTVETDVPVFPVRRT
jgi:hypothetical protein